MLSKALFVLAATLLSAAPVHSLTTSTFQPPSSFLDGAQTTPWDSRGLKFMPREVKPAQGQIASTASWYGPGFHGNRTANGETFDSYGLTAAHPSLPFGTRVRVTNLNNGRSVVVRVNDRGPYVGGRVIDLAQGAASRIGMISSGTAPVRLEVLR